MSVCSVQDHMNGLYTVTCARADNATCTRIHITLRYVAYEAFTDKPSSPPMNKVVHDKEHCTSSSTRPRKVSDSSVSWNMTSQRQCDRLHVSPRGPVVALLIKHMCQCVKSVPWFKYICPFLIDRTYC